MINFIYGGLIIKNYIYKSKKMLSCQLTSDLLEPSTQAIEFNLKCPVCWSIVKPTDDPESGATECMECEVAVCKMCVSQLKK